MKIQRIAVTSSNIKSVGYDAASETLEVEFNGGNVYRYADVSQSQYENFIGAPSLGSYLHAFIKPNHAAKKVEKE